MRLFTETMPVNTDHPWKNRSQPHVAPIHCIVLSIYQLVWRPHVVLYLLQNIHAVWMSRDVWKHNQLSSVPVNINETQNMNQRTRWMQTILHMKVQWW